MGNSSMKSWLTGPFSSLLSCFFLKLPVGGVTLHHVLYLKQEKKNHIFTWTETISNNNQNMFPRDEYLNVKR